MSTDTPVYNARMMQNYFDNNILPQPTEDIVFEILKKSGEALKREEIIRAFQIKQECEDLDVGSIVSGALAQLEKQDKITRVSHGIYRVK